MQLGIIINPAAGRHHSEQYQHDIARFCARERISLTAITLAPMESVEEATRRLVYDIDGIGVVGGDGTLNGVVNGLLSSDRPETPLAYFPAGRGKDIARSLRSWHTNQLARLSFAPQLRHVDVGIAQASNTHRFFLNETSIGTGALAADAASALPRTFGTASYLAGTLKALVNGRPVAARVTLDGSEVMDLDRCHHITIANGRYFGGGLQIAPPADLEDGVLDVIAVADVNALTIARSLPRLFRATHLKHPAVTYRRAEHVQIETSCPALVESDGEVWTSTPLTLSVAQRAITWMEPSS